MRCATNAGGISIEQAMIKGTADATITTANVLKGAVGYGKDGKRIVGAFEDPTPKIFTIRQSENPTGFQNRQYDCGFRPSMVILKPTKWTGIRSSGGMVDANVYGAVNGTTGYKFGNGPVIGVKTNTGAVSSSNASVTEINDTGFKLSITTGASSWTTDYTTEFEAIAFK